MAGLNFPGNAHYFPDQEGKDNIASFEFILGTCKSVAEDFSKDFPTSTLHWIIAEKDSSIVVESMEDGLHVYDNPVGVMTNNPPFPIMKFALNDYYALSAHRLNHKFADGVELTEYSRGMSSLGLPGDLSSKSRFVRFVFTNYNTSATRMKPAQSTSSSRSWAQLNKSRACVKLPRVNTSTLSTHPA